VALLDIPPGGVRPVIHLKTHRLLSCRARVGSRLTSFQYAVSGSVIAAPVSAKVTCGRHTSALGLALGPLATTCGGALSAVFDPR